MLAGLPASLRRLLLSEYFVLYLTVAYFVVDGGLLSRPARPPRNISNQLSNVWPLLAVAIGQTFVIIIAGIDLSLGAIMGFASVAGAVVMTSAADKLLLGGSPLWGYAARRERRPPRRHPAAPSRSPSMVMLLVGMLIGFINGSSSPASSMPAFMMTLVTLMFFSSAAIWITQSQNIVNLPRRFTTLGAGDIVSFYFGEKVDARDQAARHPALRHLPDADRARAGASPRTCS